VTSDPLGVACGSPVTNVMLRLLIRLAAKTSAAKRSAVYKSTDDRNSESIPTSSFVSSCKI